MNESKEMKNRMPDCINSSISKDFTQVPNDLLRNPTLSYKAKGILSLLLSNKEGWYSYAKTLQKMSKDGADSVNSGLKELEKEGYFLRIQYRDKKTKVRRGSFWAYTDTSGGFNILDRIKDLENQGLECFISREKPNDTDVSNHEKPDMGIPVIGPPVMGNPALIILNDKKSNNKNINSKIYLSGTKVPDEDTEKTDSSISSFNGESSLSKESLSTKSSAPDNPTSSIQQRNKLYLPIAKKLFDAIQESKNIKLSSEKPKQWSDDIRKLAERNNIHIKRINKAMSWYKEHIGDDYVPVIESGSSFREKFTKLEDAIKRSKREKYKSHTGGSQVGHYGHDLHLERFEGIEKVGKIGTNKKEMEEQS
jgi:hypothetical protein